MKELSIEEKAKAYDEALKWMRDLYPNMGIAAKEKAESIFHELRESENEEIRKWIINEIKIKHHNLDEDNVDFVDKAIAWLERQGQEPRKVSIWKHWKDGICGNGEGKLIYLIKNGDDYSLSSSLGFECDYILLSDLDNLMLDRQGTSYTKMDVDDAYLKGVRDTKNEIEKQYEANYQIRKDIATFIFKSEGYIKDRAKWMDYLGIKVRLVKEQDEQETSVVDFKANDWYVSKVDGKIRNIYHSVDKVEPKFKVGDWIIDDKNRVGIIVRILDEHYIISFDGREVQISFEWEGKLFRKWSIKDAKDGDVLAGSKGEAILMFRGIGNTEWDDVIDYYCYYDYRREDFIVQENVEYWGNIENNQLKPATKEQRDTLFAKMKEFGYEWDFEKKELMKIEDEEYNGEDYGIDSLFHAQRILEKTLGSVDGYETDDGILSHQCAITAVKKLYEQKPTWSDEDVYNSKLILSTINQDQDLSLKTKDKLTSWIKSIKQRIGI